MCARPPGHHRVAEASLSLDAANGPGDPVGRRGPVDRHERSRVFLRSGWPPPSGSSVITTPASSRPMRPRRHGGSRAAPRLRRKRYRMGHARRGPARSSHARIPGAEIGGGRSPGRSGGQIHAAPFQRHRHLARSIPRQDCHVQPGAGRRRHVSAALQAPLQLDQILGSRVEPPANGRRQVVRQLHAGHRRSRRQRRSSITRGRRAIWLLPSTTGPATPDHAARAAAGPRPGAFPGFPRRTRAGGSGTSAGGRRSAFPPPPEDR